MNTESKKMENAEGSPTLTPQKIRQAVILLCEGRDRAEIAARLGVDLAALRRHIGPIEIQRGAL